MKSRSSLKLKLNTIELNKSNLSNLERLAKFLGLNIKRKFVESDRSYKHHLIKAIQRWEKEYARGLHG